MTTTAATGGIKYMKPHNDKDARPSFLLVRYNPRRRARGAPAAELIVSWSDGAKDILWMDRRDILRNVGAWGDSPGLSDALRAYQLNKPFPFEEPLPPNDAECVKAFEWLRAVGLNATAGSNAERMAFVVMHELTRLKAIAEQKQKP